MSSIARFNTPADNSRPYKSHRYDPFGLKIARTVCLYGKAPLNAWITLESNPNVKSYCERPVVVPEVKPRLVVDFWVKFQDREELWVLARARFEEDDNSLKKVAPAFVEWATTNNMAVKVIGGESGGVANIYLDNWGRILRDLAANLRYVTSSMAEQVRQSITTPQSMEAILKRFQDEDPVLVRATAYSLLHKGVIRCTNIEKTFLGPTTILVAK